MNGSGQPLYAKTASEFFKNLLFLSDLILISGCWVAAYFIRFSGTFFPVTKGIPPIEPYLWLIVPIVFVWGICFWSLNLYRPEEWGLTSLNLSIWQSQFPLYFNSSCPFFLFENL